MKSPFRASGKLTNDAHIVNFRNPQRALKIIQEALVNNENKYWAFAEQGNIYTALSEYDAALTSFDKALKISNGDYAQSGKGRCLYLMRQYPAALQCFENALSIDDESFMSMHWKGKTLAKLNRLDEAEKQLSETIALLRINRARPGFINEVRDDLDDVRNKLGYNTIHSKKGSDSEAGSKSESSISRDYKEAKTTIIINGNNNPINLGGIQVTDDGILNRPIFTSENGPGSTDPVEPAIKKSDENKSAEKRFGNTKHSSIFSRIFQKNTCPDCGTPIQNNQKYCNNCGRKLE